MEIIALFPPRPVGRPKMQKLTAKRDRQSSQYYPLIDILGQAIDAATKEVFLLVRWADESLEETTWIPVSNLSDFASSWWALEVEKRFPGIDLSKDAPVMRITGGSSNISLR